MPASYTRTSKPAVTRALTPLKRAAGAGGLSVGLSKENSPARAVIPPGGARPSAKRIKTIDGAAMPAPQHTHSLSTEQATTGRRMSQAATDRFWGRDKDEVPPTAASLAAKKDKEAKQASLQRDEEDFVQKYTSAFPKFVFFFDSCNPGTADSRIHELGGRIERLFSKQVTHVITSRPIPVPNDKENAPPANKPTPVARPIPTAVESRVAGTSARVSKPMVNPFIDEDGGVSADVLLKAMRFKMKVWDVKKLHSVLTRLTPVAPKPSTSRPSIAHRQAQAHSLSHLLADEKLHGTRERDLSAPRPDYHYFTRGSFYVLCEDATGESRTVLAKEYDKPRGGEAPEWPVLHGNFLKASTSAPVKMESVETKMPPPKRPATASASKVPVGLSAKTRLAAVKEGGGPGDLRRSASLNSLSKTAKLAAEEERLAALRQGANDEAGVDRPYLAASGNSVGITSTITSAQSGTGLGAGGHNLAAMKRDNRRVVELPRKIAPVVSGLRGLAPSRMTDQANMDASTSKLLPSANITAANGEPVMIDLDTDPADKDDAPLAGPGPAVESRKRKHMAEHVQRTLAGAQAKGKASGRMDPPAPIRKRYSFPGAMPRREKSTVRLPAREENKKPGYCENCRIKFDDFSQHIVSRKHRRFALNAAHFKDLDTVLDRLIREPAVRAPSRFAPPPFRPAVRRAEEESESDYSEEEEAAEVSEDGGDDGDGADDEVPQWVMDEQENERAELSQAARTINEEIDEIDDEEDEDALEVDLGDEDDE